jgi:hypothetical protein
VTMIPTDMRRLDPAHGEPARTHTGHKTKTIGQRNLEVSVFNYLVLHEVYPYRINKPV